MPAGTRERLLEAAWECIRDRGLAGATSRAVTDAAGTNLGAITYHFGTKDALLSEAVCLAVERLVAPATQALRSPDGEPMGRAVTAVARLQESYAALAAEAPAYLESLVRSREFPAAHARLQAVFDGVRSLLTDQISAQREAGQLPPWIDPPTMAGVLLAVAQGIVLQSVVSDHGPAPSEIATQFAQLLFAVRTEPGPERAGDG